MRIRAIYSAICRFLEGETNQQQTERVSSNNDQYISV